MFRIRIHPITGFLLGWLLFILAMRIMRLLHSTPIVQDWLRDPIASKAVFKGVMVAMVVVLIVLTRRKFREFGFRLGINRGKDWLIGIVIAGVFSAGMAVAIVFSPAKGMGGGGGGDDAGMGMFLLDFFIGTCLISSIAEEIFDRGLIQTWMRQGGMLRLGRVRVTGRVIASGLLFGSSHLMIRMGGADWWTVGFIFVSTTMIGLLAAYYRERTRSLLLPIVVHIMANLGGLVGGMIGMTAKMMMTGPPSIPG